MDLNIEKEYKVLLTKEQFDLLSSKYDTNFILQKNTYYDNKSRTISQKKCAMRIRTKEGKCEFTFKAPTKTGDRFEFSCEVERDNPSCFTNDFSIYLLLEERQIFGPFYAIGSTVTDRAECDLDVAYLCFDVTTFDDGSVDYEVEYEYKKEHDGLTAFNKIMSDIGVEYKKNAPSKVKRCMEKKKEI